MRAEVRRVHRPKSVRKPCCVLARVGGPAIPRRLTTRPAAIVANLSRRMVEGTFSPVAEKSVWAGSNTTFKADSGCGRLVTKARMRSFRVDTARTNAGRGWAVARSAYGNGTRAMSQTAGTLPVGFAIVHRIEIRLVFKPIEGPTEFG